MLLGKPIKNEPRFVTKILRRFIFPTISRELFTPPPPKKKRYIPEELNLQQGGYDIAMSPSPLLNTG
jgi:hypothetical protein